MQTPLTIFYYEIRIVCIGIKSRNTLSNMVLLIAEVEQLLRPEELAILEQNEAPNLEKLSTVSRMIYSVIFSCNYVIIQSMTDCLI